MSGTTEGADGNDSTHGRWTEGIYAFDDFELHIASQKLVRDGQPVRLGSRATALLFAFVEHAGELLTKDQLIARAWPQTFVEEGNLRVHITALRRALGDTREQSKYINNVSGRGYRFGAAVRLLEDNKQREPKNHGLALDQTPPIAPGVLPRQLTTVIGREPEMEATKRLLNDDRLVTITGPGGIGKTTVALAVAHSMRAAFDAGAYFIDLSAVADEKVVPFAIASTVKVAIDGDHPILSLVARMSEMRALLVLDNCEHVIDMAAEVSEALLREAPGIRILATSHEPLRTEGERVQRLTSFDLPPSVDELPLSEAMKFPAVELFVEEAISNDDALMISDTDVPFIADICRKLDGLPLAIEIAAARAGSIGIAVLASRLDDRFNILTSGRRTAASRQQTLKNLLDWSHDHLEERERIVLRRLSVFAGPFTLEAAVAVAGAGLGQVAVTEAISSLVGKSLLNSGVSMGVPTFRMLDSTRLYSLERLIEAKGEESARQAHIDFMCRLLQRAEREWNHSPRKQWLERYGPAIDDIRIALGWAFSERGDASAGVILTSLAMPLVLQLGLVVEFFERARAAIAIGEGLEPRQLIPEMRLHLACSMLAFNQSLPFDEHIRRATQIAEIIGTDRSRIEPLVLSAATDLVSGQYGPALRDAMQAYNLGRKIDDEFAELSASRVLAQINHFIGDQREAIRFATSVLRHPVEQIPVTYGFVHTDRRVSMRVTLARALWLTGYGQQAKQMADEAMELARESGTLALCQVLAIATIPLLMWRGEDDLAEPLVVRLQEEAVRFSMGQWSDWASVFQHALAVRAGRSPQAITLGGLYSQTLVSLIGPLAPIPDNIDESNWCAPELLRSKGIQCLRAGEQALGNRFISEGMRVAQRQGAMAWELRCAISLVEEAASPETRESALQSLAALMSKLAEGHDTVDPLRAAALLGT